MDMHRAIVRIALPAALGAVAVGALWAQRAEEQPQRGLVKIAPRAGAQDLALDADASSWRERLTQEDLDLREQAFEALVGEAARSSELRARLEQWAGEDDGELAWTSRLALRQLERRAGPFAALSDLDAFAIPQVEPWPLDRSVPHVPHVPQALPPYHGLRGVPGVQSKVESFSFELGPDGVKAKVTREQDGESVTREYEAESLEELLDAHPELREHLDASGTGAMPFGGMQLPGALPRLQLDPRGFGGWDPFGLGTTAPRAGPLRTDVLGVWVHPLTDEERARRGLEGVEGGLVVERCAAGTIAAALGLQRGHVLVELDGRPLRSVEDISAVLSAREADEGLELVLVDRWGQRRTRAWSPADTLGRELTEPRRL